MPRVPVHDPDNAPQESQETLVRLGKRAGKVLNIFGEMAHAPVVLEMYDTVERLLAERSSLDRRTREAIHLTVANVNGCDYCQAAYTGTAVAAGHTPEDALGIRQGQLAGDQRLSALLAVCRDIAADKGYDPDRTWNGALDAGWTERQLAEAYADVVRTILTNYFNHLVGTELDLRPAPKLD